MRFSLTDQIGHEFRSLFYGYPDFVVSGRRSSLKGHTPVFVYHTIEPASFEQDLRFLAKNGYTTLGMEALVQHLTDQSCIPENAVVLTFDDARSSFWRFAYPLLQRYQMTGVLFVIAGLTIDASSVRDNLSSVWEGNRTLAEVRALDPDDTTLCTWPEIKAMYASGQVEVESHSLFHQEVFVGTEVTGFLGPESSYVPFQTSATAYLTARDVGTGIVAKQHYGLPLFRTAPLHSGQRAWEVPTGLRRHAKEQWENMPIEVRKSRRWQRWLHTRWDERGWLQKLCRQDASDVERSIMEDIARARALIKQTVSRDAGDHFCLPYTVGSKISIAAMEKLGVKSCSWGVVTEDRHNTVGGNPLRISRVKSDFLWRLPGEGQKSLVRIYAEKTGRRLRGLRVY